MDTDERIDRGPVMTTPSVTLAPVDPEHVDIETWDDDGRLVASLHLGPVTLHDDLARLAAVTHRADVLCQARLQTPGAVSPNPTVTHEPGELAGEWVFVLHAGGRRQKLRLAEARALYVALDAALGAHRKATT